MRYWAIALLVLMLAACSDPEPPTPVDEVAVQHQPEAAADLPDDQLHAEQLQARWQEIEQTRRELAEMIRQLEQEAQALVEPELPAIAILIDDVGHNLNHGRRLLALPLPVGLAILPHTAAARQLADEAAALGRNVILHQPMENGAGLPIGPGGLYSSMSPKELQQILRDNLDSFDHISGINNHMGSRLTADRRAMDQVMQVLRERGLFFIDSRTTHHTQAAFAAEAAGVPHLSRKVFLDNERSAEAIGRAFDQALKLARREGSALVIGHPYPQTIAVLEQRLTGELMREEGVEVVGIEELLARKYRR